MNYINKGKRDVLIFPKFNNIDKIQNIRRQYDELSDIIPPHITLVFPFERDFSDEFLQEQLTTICKKYRKFKIKCHGITLEKDERINKYFIFLNIIEGESIIRDISGEIYNKIFNKNIPNDYIPHITLGTVDRKIDIELNDYFETIIEHIEVEYIGENEESIIRFSINLS